MGNITVETAEKVARLARMRLQPEELKQIAGQLDSILEYVRQLQAVDTDGVEPTAHVLPLSNVLRADAPRPSLPQEAVTALAPQKRHPFIAVPKVIDA